MPIAFAFIAAILFGLATPISKTLLSEFSPYQLAGLLYLGAAGGLLMNICTGTPKDIMSTLIRQEVFLIGYIIPIATNTKKSTIPIHIYQTSTIGICIRRDNKWNKLSLKK